MTTASLQKVRWRSQWPKASRICFMAGESSEINQQELEFLRDQKSLS